MLKTDHYIAMKTSFVSCFKEDVSNGLK